MHSDAKQTEIQSGTDKGLLQGNARRWVVHDPQEPQPP